MEDKSAVVSGLSDHQDYSAFFRAVSFGLVR